MLAKRQNRFACEALVRREKEICALVPEAVLDRFCIDDMMQFYAGRDEE